MTTGGNESTTSGAWIFGARHPPDCFRWRHAATYLTRQITCPFACRPASGETKQLSLSADDGKKTNERSGAEISFEGEATERRQVEAEILREYVERA